jgi:3-hydroxyacyl-[acyl-carrier-protein] dehydratase
MMSESINVSLVMDVTAIRRILPHRYPFLLVDKVISFSRGPNYPNRTGTSIHAVKNVTLNEPFFNGHFPHRPVMPGVLILESMCQVAALAGWRPEDPKQDVAMIAINNAKFRQPVVPGDTLNIHCQLIRDRGRLMEFHCKAYVEGKLVAESDLLAKMFDLVEEK